MNHVMLDLETLGTKPGCAILTVGAVEFDPLGVLSEPRTFYAKVSLGSAMACGLQIEPDTLIWWTGQGDEARSEAFCGLRHSLSDALADFTSWLGEVPEACIWVHGAAFDIPILAAAYDALGLMVPWYHRAVRDTRTLADLVPDSNMSAFEPEIPHHALHDAAAQARFVQWCYAHLHA